jgi:hypothetical protein
MISPSSGAFSTLMTEQPAHHKPAQTGRLRDLASRGKKTQQMYMTCCSRETIISTKETCRQERLEVDTRAVHRTSMLCITG